MPQALITRVTTALTRGWGCLLGPSAVTIAPLPPPHLLGMSQEIQPTLTGGGFPPLLHLGTSSQTCGPPVCHCPGVSHASQETLFPPPGHGI